MPTSEEKFIEILDDMFLGLEIVDFNERLFEANTSEVNYNAREKQGFIKLLKAKSNYFNAFKNEKITSKDTKLFYKTKS